MKPFKQSTVTVVNVLAFIVSISLVFSMTISLAMLATLEPDANMWEIREGLAAGATVVLLISFGVLLLFVLYPIFKKYYEAMNK